MKYMKMILIGLLIGFSAAVMGPVVTAAQQQYPDPQTYFPSVATMDENKMLFDDPRPVLKNLSLKKIVPKGLYDKLVFDQEEMKSLWSELVGFKAPDMVGKIAQEIKPGKYTYKDVQQTAGFKQLMYQDLYNRIGPGGPPHIGKIPEFEIIPTRQYYWALPIAKAAKQNISKIKLDGQGYLVWQTYQGGIAFPRPSGPFKAQQIMYNIDRFPDGWERNVWLGGRATGLNGKLKVDFDGFIVGRQLRLGNRTLIEPHGWFDNRARDQGEAQVGLTMFVAPRDQAGTVMLGTIYQDPNKLTQGFMYIPAFRRVRKMSSTDTQDAVGGQDQTIDDSGGWSQKLSPAKYPYKYEVMEEREYLVVAPTLDGSEYLSSKEGYALKNAKLERRPIYVLKLTQLDRNYVYGQRVLYVDRETFCLYHMENYDQKGRLYRSSDNNYAFHSEMGIFSNSGSIYMARDHRDLHSSFNRSFQYPAASTREQVKIEGNVTAK